MEDRHVGMTKAVLWEEAKGKLRALANVEGHREGPHDERFKQWRTVNDAVEAFIKEFEDNGLQE